jgi:predicted DNA-binding transcriptional regulator AlpA
MPKYLRFRDLVARGVVNNRMTLRRWIAAGTFPAPVSLGPNTKAWLVDEVEAAEAARLAERDARTTRAA